MAKQFLFSTNFLFFNYTSNFQECLEQLFSEVSLWIDEE